MNGLTLPRRVLVTGARGQLGRTITARIPAGIDVIALDSATLDITDADMVEATITRARPDVVVNAAAYTAVDRAESEPERARIVNRDGAANLARAAGRTGARLIHLSTDFVFDGKQRTPYRPDAVCRPLSVYGATKRDGELAVTELTDGSALVLRTSWVYASHGDNFVRTMLRLMREGQPLRVVADQVGSPTWAGGLADAIWAAIARPEVTGIAHWADAGEATRHQVAEATRDEAQRLGLIPEGVTVEAITTHDLPRPAARPAYSALDTAETATRLGIRPEPWRTNLRRMLEELCSIT